VTGWGIPNRPHAYFWNPQSTARSHGESEQTAQSRGESPSYRVVTCWIPTHADITQPGRSRMPAQLRLHWHHSQPSNSDERAQNCCALRAFPSLLCSVLLISSRSVAGEMEPRKFFRILRFHPANHIAIATYLPTTFFRITIQTNFTRPLSLQCTTT
jgi:hypothetical protein